MKIQHLIVGALNVVAMLSGALLSGTALAANVTVNLTAAPSMSAPMADGNTVHMWSYCTTSGAGGCAGNWAPGPTITATSADTLTINLTNSLPEPTSIVILGQLGGGLGSPAMVNGPVHSGTTVTWPAVDPTTGFTPPKQGLRAQSFGLETAGGASNPYVWNKLRPGTYLYTTGTHPSIQQPMGLYGVLVVSDAATGKPYAGVSTDAESTLLFSEIDPVQNNAVYQAFAGNTALPAAVNYTPLYFLINGHPYDKTNPVASTNAMPDVIPTDSSGVVTGSGKVLLRLVNAGLRQHIADVVGLPATLVAEDGNLLPGNPRQQSVVVLTAGKTMDVTLAPAKRTASCYADKAYAVFDRQGSLSSVAVSDSGMLAYLAMTNAGNDACTVNGTASDTKTVLGNSNVPSARPVANADAFTVPYNSATYSGNVLANDVGLNKSDLTQPLNSTYVQAVNGLVAMQPNGTFSYTPGTFNGGTFVPGGTVQNDTFSYTGYDASGNAYVALVTLNVSTQGGAPSAGTSPIAYTSNLASRIQINRPGLLGFASDPSNLMLKAQLVPGQTLPADFVLNADGSFSSSSSGSSLSFQFFVTNSQGTPSVANTVNVTFPAGSGLAVNVLDSQDRSAVTGYRWTIEEDTTYLHDPNNPAGTGNPPQSLATNFHKSSMPVVATGCVVGAKGAASCGTAPIVALADVALDPSKRYFISVLPEDIADGSASYDANGNVTVVTKGHSMGGAQIPAGSAGVKTATVLVPPNPLPPGQMSVFVFEDNNPTNGGVDDGEPGLGGFQVQIYDTRGSSGDPVGLITYDAVNMPLNNSLMGTPGCPGNGPVGTIITCPEGTGSHRVSALKKSGTLVTITTSSPHQLMVGEQVALSGMSAGSYLNGKTLAVVGIPTPTSFTVTVPNNANVGSVRPNSRASDANQYSLAGMALIKNIPGGRYDVWATPGAERAGRGEEWIQVSTLEGTPANDTFVKPGEPAYWQEFGSPGFHSFIGFVNKAHLDQAHASAKGTNTVTGVVSSLHMDRPPAANLNDSCANPTGLGDPSCRATLSATTCYVGVNTQGGTGPNVAFGKCDLNGNFTLTGVPDGTHELVIWDEWLDQIIAKKAITVSGGTTLDTGHVPVFSWFTRIEESAFIDLNGNGIREDGEPGIAAIPMNVRFRDGSISNFLTTDADGHAIANELFPLFNWYVVESDTTRFKGTGVHVTYDAGGKPDAAGQYAGLLNSKEAFPLTLAQNVPGSNYAAGTTSRVDPGTTLTEGLQGYINQTAVLEWGKIPYNQGENGGINGMVYYASTRGFDDPGLEVQTSWQPGVAHVKVNLYQKTINADGTVSLKKVDSTLTSSWDDSAKNTNCPGQDPADPFVAVTLGAGNASKCYDGQHVFNQVQPVAYDGLYNFPSANCTICSTKTVTNPDGSMQSLPLLPTGTYVVEVEVPTGYDIVKEEDKNILIGDSFIAPAQTQFAGVANIFILPDQATVIGAQPNINTAPSSFAGAAFPKCVGSMHTVPQFLTIVPDAQQVSPFAGQDRALCDRREVVLEDQMQATGGNFPIFTPAPVSAHIVGMMLNDASAEFNPFSPSFGEKPALPNAPVSVRDYTGVELMRMYNDKWGTFNGLVPSTFDANAPNPSGYQPNMLTFCMNDPLITDPATGLQTPDPSYNPQFSNFCYVWPGMAGITTYLDTPVLPVSAFANTTSYNPVDCAYPDATPAISRVDGDGVGPYLSATGTGHVLKIKSQGVVSVANPAYDGPTSTDALGKQPKITRNYGFGTPAGKVQLVDAAGKITDLVVNSWADGEIDAYVPTTFALNQGKGAGELVVTAANGSVSVDTVTVNIEPTTPKVVMPAAGSAMAHPIQDAIDAAIPGDLIILEAGGYPELVIMDKPVRLQGVGAASVMISATKYPNQKVADWRTRINTEFGIDADGNQTLPAKVDPLPVQEITGGIVRLEPSVLATEEGAGITVLAHDGQGGGRNECSPTIRQGNKTVPNPNYSTSDFNCAQSRIDGISVTGGDAGGGIYVNGWAHNLEISNNRVFGNAGPYSGGVRVGQPYLESEAAGNGPFGYNKNVNIHHNAITTNGSVEANAAPGAVGGAGAGGGLSICSGSDNYKVTNNFVCGNFTQGDGGGIGHIGLSDGGLIARNWIVFNQSFQQTNASHGGGLIIEGEVSNANGLSLGTGNVTVDSNLIQGNFAESGSGGGVRLQSVNGTDASSNSTWTVTLSNNMIVNNVAGWAGAGVSLSDAIDSVIVNNTIASNDTVGITGNLFNTAFNNSNTGANTTVANPSGISSELTSSALLAALNPGASPGCGAAGSTAYTRCVTLQTWFTGGRVGAQPTCSNSCNRYNTLLAWIQKSDRYAAAHISSPLLENNIVWHNRSFFFDMSNQSYLNKAMIFASNNWQDSLAHNGTALSPQSSTGACDATDKYWDLGVVGDTSTTPGAYKLNPVYSVLSDVTNYSAPSNTSGDPKLVKSYCNGSRVQPGRQFEPGTPFLPAFNIQPAATLDEAGNFVDMQYGPLSLNDPALPHAVVGDYHLQANVGSSAVDAGTTVATVTHDIDGDSRPQGVAYDIGADEIPAKADLSITKTDGVSSVLPGSSVTYTIVVTNGSQILANGATVTDAMPAALTGVRWTCAVTGGAVVSNTACDGVSSVSGSINRTISTFPGASTVTFTVTGTVSSSASGSLVNTATVTAPNSITDTNPANNSQSDTDTILAPSGNLSPNPVPFGNQNVNTTSTSVQVNFTNTTGAPITLRSGTSANLANANGPAVGLTGANSSNYAIASGTTCTNGAVIPDQGTCVVNVTFTPSTTGVRSATLNIYLAGSTGALATDGLTGTGVVPPQAVVSFSGSTLMTTLPATRATKNVLTTITNTGTAALVISNIGIAVNTINLANPGTFSVANPGSLGSTACPIGGAGLAAGASCQVTVTYTPPATGTLNLISGTLTLTDSGAAATTQTRLYIGN